MKVPGVLAVLTGGDAAADGLRAIPHHPVPTNPHEVPLKSRDGSAFFIAPHAPLPTDRARFVGEAVALVIAETPAAAKDGVARVSVDYEPLPAVTATVDAVAADAPLVWKETTSNLCVDSEAGDAAADAAFRRAAHVVRLETQINRVTGVPLEPRAALGVYDEASGRYTLYAGSGGSVRIKTDLAGTLGVPESAVRVVAREVGGNYGTIPSSRWSPGRRSVSAVRSNGRVNGRKRSSPTIRHVISPRRSSSRSTRRATSSRSAASTRATSARTPCRSSRSPRASRCCRASITFPPRPCGAGRCSATRRPRIRIAAPAAPR